MNGAAVKSASSTILLRHHASLPLNFMCDNATNNASTAEYCRGLFLSKRSNYSNVTQPILNKLGISLHNLRNHPLEIIKRKIYSYFGATYETFDHLSPLVRVEDNFDSLLIPSTHAARSKSDTYYVNETTVLRTHTSAHQSQLLSQGRLLWLSFVRFFFKRI